jgi:hypothetical protein
VEQVHAAGGRIFPQLWHVGIRENLIQFILKGYFERKKDDINNVKDYFKGFNLILKLYSSDKERFNRDFLKTIKEKLFLIGGGIGQYRKISGVSYWVDDHIEKLYSSLNFDLNFVNQKIYYDNIEGEYHDILPRFMNDIGLNTNTFEISPRRTTENNYFEFHDGNNNQKIFDNRKKQADFFRYYVTIYNPTILHFQSILDNITDLDGSKALFHLIVEFIKEIEKSSHEFNRYKYSGGLNTTIEYMTLWP